jgi:hypothetical protein
MGGMPNSGILPPLPHPIAPAKARMTKSMNVATSRGYDAKHDGQPIVHHLEDVGKYL